MARNEKTSNLSGLPTEILLEIYYNLDLTNAYQLTLVNKLFNRLFAQHKVAILLFILSRDFSPFDELLQVYTAAPEDLSCTYNSVYKPRTIIFKRFAGDAGILMTPAPGPSSLSNSSGYFIAVGKGGRGLLRTGARTAVLTEKDLQPILKHCRLVQQWEELFPQMRWFYAPENCRFLRPHESMRFRRAFYRWWLYGTYFHEGLPRPRVGLPEPYVEDMRTSLLRYLSIGELLELMDLVETMKDVVLQYICPRLDPTHQNGDVDEPPELILRIDRAHSLSHSWRDGSSGRSWARILKTYAKLGPEKLMYYFENIYSYSRKRLISEVCLQHPNFTLDQESIQTAVRCVLDERQWQTKVPLTMLAEDTVGGVVDFDDVRDQERELFEKDGNVDGSLPPGIKHTRSYSQYSPRGDDGSCLDDRYHPQWASR